MLNRRQLLRAGAGTLLAAAAAPWARSSGLAGGRSPFSLGVASGYPTPDGMVIWTRLAPEPLAPGGGLPPDAILPVVWEIAGDDQFRRIVRTGVAYATPEDAHSLHVEPAGLQPDRPYWYRFRLQDHVSATGRTRTAPGPATQPARLRIALASCQQYEHGYYTAYRHMLGENLDLVIHVGDYIYELSWGDKRVRHHNSPECYSLDDYRIRHALYKTDADLQGAHAACPWLVTWDDHEVDNDYAAELDEEGDPARLFLARRAAAYQAYYEHMPLPRRARPFGADMRLHAARTFGDLAQVYLLDGRQFRSPHACPPPGRRGGSRTDCAELRLPERTMLGDAQEQWLAARLRATPARWNLLAQQTVMTHVDEMPGPGEQYWTDAWNGYPAARQRLLDTLAEPAVSNPVVFSGDIHAFGVANLNRRPADPDSPVVASEFITSSITSQSVATKLVEERVASNANVLMATAEHRGYVRLVLTPDRLEATLLGVKTDSPGDATGRVVGTYVVEAARPGPQPA